MNPIDRPLSEAALKIADLVIALGEDPINKLEGAWTHQVDDQWFVAANGHREPVRVEGTAGRMGFELQPFDFAVWYNGWLAGTFNSFGDGCIAAGEGANEEALMAALDQAIVKAGVAV